MASRPVAWLRDHPMAADSLLALLLAGIALPAPFVAGGGSRGGDAVAVVLVLAETLPVAWRRCRPDAALVVVGGATLAYNATGYGIGVAWPAFLVVVFSFAAHRRQRSQLWPVIVFGAELVANLPLDSNRGGNGIAGFAGALAISAVAWVVGDVVRTRRGEASLLVERVERAEAEREAKAIQAVTTERARIARELHDVVAHALGVIVMQAGGAARVDDLDPAEAKDVLGSIEQCGRQAFVEMRRLVDVLRDDEDGTDRAPQPTIDEIPALVAQLAETGLKVSMVVEGEPHDAPSGVELSAFRIVQEALTNTLKHAGRADARVTLRWGADDLELEILDDGDGVMPGSDTAMPADSGGHGLVGMRERVALFDGELEVGPRAGGGFAVRARLPLNGKA